MERLTREKRGKVCDGGRHPTRWTSDHTTQEVVTRLAAYEDTWLEPEEIKLYKEAQEISESMAPARLIELAQAEKAGRLVVLPCNVGDTVYRVFTAKDREPVVVPCEIKTVGQAADLVGRIGKKGWMVSTYLTRQEAEEALRKEGNNG